MKSLRAMIGLLFLLLAVALPVHARETEGGYQVRVTVAGVATIADYGRAMQYLQSLDLVTKVKVAEVAGDGVLFLLDARGDLNSLDRAIALGATLRRVTAMGDDNQTPVYQLLP